jgi:hypothetical protein
MIPAVKGLQATYFGNFRTSDRAWFALLDYAKRYDIKLTNHLSIFWQIPLTVVMSLLGKLK